jgi:flavodoxin
MNRAIVFYSKTGNTESVVKRFKDFDILRVKASSDDPNQKVVELVERPDVKDYEEVIFACPVHGFMICKVMKTYLTELEDLSGKTIDLFVTHQFPVSWLGGNQTLKQMKKLIERKNGVVRNMTSINWSSKKKESVIEEMLNRY